MSPQGLQAHSVLQKMKKYNPKRDTKSGSLWKFLKREANKHLESGVLPENERQHFSPQFENMMSAAPANDYNYMKPRRRLAA
jgi:hypothetical protein